MAKLRPQKQLITHNPSEGKFGDCYRTAVAIVMGVPASEVPHVCEKGWCNADDLDGLIAMRDFLRSKGFAISKSVFNGELTWPKFREWMAKFNPDSAIIVTGGTVRDTNHCVVMVGGEVICDPLTGLANQEPFSKAALADGELHWWVETITTVATTPKETDHA
jgi:hypothetical protein